MKHTLFQTAIKLAILWEGNIYNWIICLFSWVSPASTQTIELHAIAAVFKMLKKNQAFNSYTGSQYPAYGLQLIRFFLLDMVNHRISQLLMLIQLI